MEIGKKFRNLSSTTLMAIGLIALVGTVFAAGIISSYSINSNITITTTTPPPMATITAVTLQDVTQGTTASCSVSATTFTCNPSFKFFVGDALRYNISVTVANGPVTATVPPYSDSDVSIPGLSGQSLPTGSDIITVGGNIVATSPIVDSSISLSVSFS